MIAQNNFPDNIIDIKFKGNKSYILKQINICSADVEKQLSTQCYSGQNKSKSIEVENMKLPPFVLSFYMLVFELSRIPTEKELIEHYTNNHLLVLNDKKFSCDYLGSGYTFEKDAIEGRILRTYPTLVRDFHFYLMCKEANVFDEVTYSLAKDYFDGIDLLIEYRTKHYHVSLMVNTLRSKKYKEIKYRRHDYRNANEIVLEIDLTSKSKKVSNYYLYSENVLNNLIEKIKLETEKIDF